MQIMHNEELNDEVTTDWWRCQMYKQVATLIHHPTLEAETRLKVMVGEYRRFVMHSINSLEPKHLLGNAIYPRDA